MIKNGKKYVRIWLYFKILFNYVIGSYKTEFPLYDDEKSYKPIPVAFGYYLTWKSEKKTEINWDSIEKFLKLLTQLCSHLTIAMITETAKICV